MGKTVLPKLNYNDFILHTPHTVATAFRDYFLTNSDNLDSNVPHDNKNWPDWLGQTCQYFCFETLCTVNEVKLLLKSTPIKIVVQQTYQYIFIKCLQL